MESFTKYSLNGMLGKSFFFFFWWYIKPATNSVTSYRQDEWVHGPGNEWDKAYIYLATIISCSEAGNVILWDTSPFGSHPLAVCLLWLLLSLGNRCWILNNSVVPALWFSSSSAEADGLPWSFIVLWGRGRIDGKWRNFLCSTKGLALFPADNERKCESFLHSSRQRERAGAVCLCLK